MQRTPDQRQYRPDNLSWLSAELRDEVRFVDDRDLKGRIYEWLREVAQLPGGDVLDIVDHHLTTIRRIDDDSEKLSEYPMRRIEGDGEGDFPDSCAGCDHYGTRCPVFVDPVERRRREQLQADLEGADTSEKRRRYRRYGENVGCHQIAQALADHVEAYEELQIRGLDLIEESDVNIGFTGEADELARAEAEAVHGDR